MNPMAQDRISSRINNFVQSSMVSFKQNLNSAKSFFKGFFLVCSKFIASYEKNFWIQGYGMIHRESHIYKEDISIYKQCKKDNRNDT